MIQLSHFLSNHCEAPLTKFEFYNILNHILLISPFTDNFIDTIKEEKEQYTSDSNIKLKHPETSAKIQTSNLSISNSIINALLNDPKITEKKYVFQTEFIPNFAYSSSRKFMFPFDIDLTTND